MDCEARLASINGGSLRNAIPREAFAVITIPQDALDDMLELVAEFDVLYNSEFKNIENKIILSAEQVDLPAGLIPEEVQDDLINSVIAAHDGVYRVIPELPSVVETSGNLAIIKSDSSKITCISLLRSSVESFKNELGSMFSSLFSMAGAKVTLTGSYPGWKPNLESPILNTMKQLYQDNYGKVPKILIIHAGLECGILGTHYPEMDMISFGPTIRFPHSPDEKVHIDSVLKFWDYLLITLKNIPSK
jgi:dipeptidase D